MWLVYRKQIGRRLMLGYWGDIRWFSCGMPALVEIRHLKWAWMLCVTTFAITSPSSEPR
jgi:hypothetical protein